MQSLFLSVLAYLQLIRHDLFMARHDFRGLCQAIRELPLRPRSNAASCIAQVDSALTIACAFYPKQVLCLQYSAVLVRLLRAHGIAAQLIIGTQTLPFRAHAWVVIDGEIFNDRLASRETFQVLEVL